jgi:PAS domain-containing protein
VHKDGHEIPLGLSLGQFTAGPRRVFTAFMRDVSERTRMEDELRVRQQHLLIALEAGRMGTWDWHIPTGQVVWSPGLEKIHGREPGTFPGTLEAVIEEIHPADRARVEAEIRRSVETGAEYRVRYRIALPGREIRWLEARGRVLRDASGAAVRMLGVCTDLSDTASAMPA